MTKILKEFRDNRYAQVILFPLCFYNTMHSLYIVVKQSQIFKSVINENDDFFKSLITMGITKDNFFYGYTAKYKYDETLFTDPQMILETAREKIIDVVMNYVKDDNLLGVIQVGVDIVGDHVIMYIRPSQWKLFKQDFRDMVRSIAIWTITIGAITYFL